MKVLYLNSQGGGFADYVEIGEGTTGRPPIIYRAVVRVGIVPGPPPLRRPACYAGCYLNDVQESEP